MFWVDRSIVESARVPYVGVWWLLSGRVRRKMDGKKKTVSVRILHRRKNNNQRKPKQKYSTVQYRKKENRESPFVDTATRHKCTYTYQIKYFIETPIRFGGGITI